MNAKDEAHILTKHINLSTLQSELRDEEAFATTLLSSGQHVPAGVQDSIRVIKLGIEEIEEG